MRRWWLCLLLCLALGCVRCTASKALSESVIAEGAGGADASGASEGHREVQASPEVRREAQPTSEGSAGATVKTRQASTGSALEFRSYGLVVDSKGNVIFTDTLKHQIVRLDATGTISILAGSVQGYRDGPGAQALFKQPHGIGIDSQDNIYVTDSNNHRIRKIDSTGEVSTLAGSGQVGSTDGEGMQAQFHEPQGIAVASDGTVYVADTVNHRIRKIDSTGKVTTVAGSSRGYKDANGKDAQFNFIFGIVIASDGTLYVSDSYNHRIRKVEPTGKVTTFAGSGAVGDADGVGTSASFNQPHGLSIDADGNLYVADMQNHRIRRISPSGEVTTIAGSTQGLKDGTAFDAQFNKPYALFFATSGQLHIADTYNYRLRIWTRP